jgi:hypothetical protein
MRLSCCDGHRRHGRFLLTFSSALWTLGSVGGWCCSTVDFSLWKARREANVFIDFVLLLFLEGTVIPVRLLDEVPFVIVIDVVGLILVVFVDWLCVGSRRCLNGD